MTKLKMLIKKIYFVHHKYCASFNILAYKENNNNNKTWEIWSLCSLVSILLHVHCAGEQQSVAALKADVTRAQALHHCHANKFSATEANT